MDGIIPALHGFAVPIDELVSLERNPHRGDVEAVKRSYVQFGQRKPIVARHRDDEPAEVTAGNTQLAAARELGWSQIAVVFTDDDDLTAKAWALADNRTAELGLYDEEALIEYLQAVSGTDLFEATGYVMADIEQLLAHIGGPAVFADVDPDDLDIDFRCPSCGYEWSGSPTPGMHDETIETIEVE